VCVCVCVCVFSHKSGGKERIMIQILRDLVREGWLRKEEKGDKRNLQGPYK